jgi:hypothetical protein
MSNFESMFAEEVAKNFGKKKMKLSTFTDPIKKVYSSYMGFAKGMSSAGASPGSIANVMARRAWSDIGSYGRASAVGAGVGAGYGAVSGNTSVMGGAAGGAMLGAAGMGAWRGAGHAYEYGINKRNANLLAAGAKRRMGGG